MIDQERLRLAHSNSAKLVVGSSVLEDVHGTVKSRIVRHDHSTNAAIGRGRGDPAASNVVDRLDADVGVSRRAGDDILALVACVGDVGDDVRVGVVGALAG